MKPAYFESQQVCRIIDIPERTLRYMADRNVITPSVKDSGGRQGKRRRFSVNNLVEIALAKECFENRITLMEIKAIVEFVRKADMYSVEKGQFWLVIQNGRAVGALYSAFPKRVVDKLKQTPNKWLKDLGKGTKTRLGDRIENILKEGEGGVSLLIIGIHYLKNQILSKLQKERQ